MRYFHYMILLGAMVTGACSGSSNAGRETNADKTRFTRLDKIVAQFSEMTQQQQFATVDSFAIPFNDYIYMMGASTGDIRASIDSLSHTAAFTMFEPEIEKAFSSTEQIEKRLGGLNANMSKQLPSLPSYSYYGILSPYRQQVILVDSVVFVALNHYLGGEHEAYSSMPDYTRRTKAEEYIPVDIAEAIVAVEYPFTASDNEPAAVNYFIYEGALLKAVSSLTGEDNIAFLLGWTPDQLATVQASEAEIWRKMAADNMIYSTDMHLARRLCSPAPSSSPISVELPGRIGRYIGYRIVCSYLANNPATTISDILSPAFYNSPTTLINSSYTPDF